MALKKIGVVALSTPVEPSRVERGVARLKSFGIEAVFPVDPSREYGKSTFLFSAASATDRARALEGLFKDPSVDAIMSLRGGYGTLEILELFDFSIAKKYPKPFVGYSDSTAIMLPLRDRAGSTVIHGPGLEGAFSSEDSDTDRLASAEKLISYLKGGSYQVPVTLLAGPSKEVTGEVTGGNLSMLSAMVGTPFLTSFKGKILFFEEVGEKPYRIHRMLLQLKLAGFLQGLKAVLIGDVLKCDHAAGQGASWTQCIQDVLSPLQIPVFQASGFGHGPKNFPLPLGITLKIRNSSLEVPSLTAL